VNAIWGADARDFSLLFALWYIAAAGNSQQPGNLERLVSTGGGAQESRFVGGSQLISIKLAEQLGRSVVLESPVRMISQSRGGVTVETDRHSIRAKRVVVTIPPAMTNQIAYDPPLPPQRAQLIQRMPAGTLIKAEAIYSTPFWRQSGLSGQAVSDTGPARTTFDNSPRTEAQASCSDSSAGKTPAPGGNVRLSSVVPRCSTNSPPTSEPRRGTPLTTWRKTRRARSGSEAARPPTGRRASCSTMGQRFVSRLTASTGLAARRRPTGSATWTEPCARASEWRER
jgi:monoamine oxidase